MSARKTSFLVGAFGHPHSVMSPRKQLIASTLARRSEADSGAPVRLLRAAATAVRVRLDVPAAVQIRQRGHAGVDCGQVPAERRQSAGGA